MAPSEGACRETESLRLERLGDGLGDDFRAEQFAEDFRVVILVTLLDARAVGDAVAHASDTDRGLGRAQQDRGQEGSEGEQGNKGAAGEALVFIRMEAASNGSTATLASGKRAYFPLFRLNKKAS